MKFIETPLPLALGAPAPDITVAAATRDGSITLSDYRGRSAVLVALFRGLYCAFCRHHVGLLGLMSDTLRAAGVEPIGIVGSPVDKARFYFQRRPQRYLIGADPDLASHRVFGIPRAEMTDDIVRLVVENNDRLAREEGLQFTPGAGRHVLDRRDGLVTTEHEPDMYRHQAQFTGQFLIDRDGVVRWSNVECAGGDLRDIDRFPTSHELLAGARAMIPEIEA